MIASQTVIADMPTLCFSWRQRSITVAPITAYLELPVKNVFGLNVIFSAFTVAPAARSSFEEDSSFNPTPSVVSRARMQRRAARSTDENGELRKAG